MNPLTTIIAGAALALALPAANLALGPAAGGASAEETRKDQSRLPLAENNEAGGDGACISHVELHGPNGIRYVLQTSDGMTLYSGRHRANETILFKNRDLPSITTKLTPNTDATVKIVTSSARDGVFAKSARLN
ncbi:hypothetical protein GR183_01855 [Stappia sp. GBMRC 2046]|uniref:Uncharacterized protein n=1 Tax=Stappia sediminis TaxID=2692190 RepID=A0A7X3LR93_9HYPH|nr:hypothetical protein [Stappia sediminis]MXN63634.1 hypothetical protein [Stappia sediminis]